jgi:hypothetical protein
MVARNRMDALVFGENVTYCCDIPIASSGTPPEQQVRDQINFLRSEVHHRPLNPELKKQLRELELKFQEHLKSGAKAEVPEPIPQVTFRR